MIVVGLGSLVAVAHRGLIWKYVIKVEPSISSYVRKIQTSQPT